MCLFANGIGRATVYGEPATLPCMHIQQLQFSECWYGDSPLHISICSTLTIHELLHLARSTILTVGWTVLVSLMWWPVAWNMGLEVSIEGTSLCSTLQLLHHYHVGTVKNYMHIGIFNKCVAVPFKHRFAKQLLVHYWKNSTWLYTEFTGNECLIYSSIHAQLTNHCKHDRYMFCWLGEAVVIYIVHSQFQFPLKESLACDTFVTTALILLLSGTP